MKKVKPLLIGNQRGFSLVGTLVASAVLGVLIVSFSKFTAGQAKSVRRMNQKFATMKTEQLLTRALADPFVCTCILGNMGTSSFSPVDGKIQISRLRSSGGSCSTVSGGNPTGIATVSDWLNGDPALGVFVTDIYLDSISGGTPVPNATGFAPQAQHSGRIVIVYGNEPNADATLMAPVRPAEATVHFLVENGNTMVGCAGSSFDRYFAQKVQTHETHLERIEDDADAEIIRVQQAIPGAVTEATRLMTIEKDRIVAEARALLDGLTPPPVEPPPGTDCSGFSGTAQLLSASHYSGSVVSAQGRGGVPNGTTGLEFQVNGVVVTSVPGSAGSSPTAMLSTTASSGQTVQVRVIGIDNNGCRSSPSNQISVFIP